MAQVHSPWRVLRPVLLAGAATVAWLTLSTSPALADTPLESDSLVAGVTSSVPSLSAPVTNTVEPLLTAVSPVSLPAESLPAELLPADFSHAPIQSVVGTVAGTADQLLAAVPVVDSIIPPDIVSSVAVPVATVAEETTTGLVEAVVPGFTEALPILEPVVQPADDFVSLPLPAPLPDLSGSGAPSGQQDLEAGAAAAPVSAVVAMESVDAAVGSAGTAFRPLPGFAGSSLAMSWAAVPSATPGSPAPDAPSYPPVPAPAGPVSGAGSGAAPSGPLSPAACLDQFGLYLPLRESFRFGVSPSHSPSPVSFDPGSSPD